MASIRNPNFVIRNLLVVFLFLFALSAPHSIAATQISWGVGLLLWTLLFLFRPRPKTYRTPLDYPLLCFFIITFISALASYAPDISIGKLRSASLFTIVYLFAENVNAKRLLRALAFALIFSCMVNVAYVIGDRIIGRGVRVDKLTDNSPLLAAQIYDGDTILKVNNRSIRSLDQLDAALRSNGASNNANEVVKLLVYRTEAYLPFALKRGDELAGNSAQERLGVLKWSHGRDQRAEGFYDHYTTYSEALQLILSLAFGLLVAAYRAGALRERASSRLPAFASWGILLSIAVIGMSVALFLTLTRASWAAFLVSAFVILILAAKSRAQAVKTALLAGALAVPLIIGGIYFLHQKRKVGFYDRSDGSILWRETVYREAVGLFTKSPRNFFVGVGMDSIKRYKDEWGLFDHGKLPPGHFHSEPLQIAVERGVFALVVWIILIVLYLRMLFPLARGNLMTADDEKSSRGAWIERGLALGAFGGVVGFVTSGMVHNNLGDSEVAMIFYFIMGLSIVNARLSQTSNAADEICR